MIKLYITKLREGENPHEAARRALEKALLDAYGKRLADFKIKKTPSGKPYFTDCAEIKFNLSHSDDYAAAALADCEVGVDIERIRHINPRIIKRFLCRLDVGVSDEEIIEAWCKKESYGKYVGTGIVGADFSKPHHIQVFNNIPGYKIAVCSAEKQTAEIKVIL